MNAPIDRLRPEFVSSFPSSLQPGVLYVSTAYRTCGHLCACGCGAEVITPLDSNQWAITFDGQDVTLSPSVGNWALPCKSHYLVSRGRIVWSRRYTDTQIQAARDFDRIALGIDTPSPQVSTPQTKWWRRLTRGGRAK